MFSSNEKSLVPCTELYETMPVLQEIHWTPRILAALIRSKVLYGERDTHSKVYLSSVAAIRRALDARKRELFHQSQIDLGQ